MITTTSSFSSLFGTKKDQVEAILVAVIMLLVTSIYEAISLYVIPDFQINWFEFGGTWAGLTCVWLARTQNVLTWPIGIISAALLGYFFLEIGLAGQQWLNWGYFLIIQLWAWPQWVWGGSDRSVLPITKLRVSGRALTFIVISVLTLVVYVLIEYIAPQSHFPILDAIVVASSLVAQFLLGKKKMESWFLWLGPVNLLSIALFYLAGAYTVMALYIAFFIHAVLALKDWQQKAK